MVDETEGSLEDAEGGFLQISVLGTDRHQNVDDAAEDGHQLLLLSGGRTVPLDRLHVDDRLVEYGEGMGQQKFVLRYLQSVGQHLYDHVVAVGLPHRKQVIENAIIILHRGRGTS